MISCTQSTPRPPMRIPEPRTCPWTGRFGTEREFNTTGTWCTLLFPFFAKLILRQSDKKQLVFIFIKWDWIQDVVVDLKDEIAWITCQNFQSVQVGFQFMFNVIVSHLEKFIKYKMSLKVPGILQDLFPNQKVLPIKSAVTDSMHESKDFRMVKECTLAW